MNAFKKLISSFTTTAAVVSSLFLFHSTVAQEKEALNIKSTTIEYHINKNTKDNELEEIKKEVNNEKIANLEFSKIKRNNKGEIISISTRFKDERGSSQQKSEYNSNGISDFTIKIHQNEAGDRYLEIGNKTNQILDISRDPLARTTLYSEQANEELEDFFAQDFMQLMKGMQEDMKAQQEMFLELLREHEENTSKEKIEPKKK